MNRFKLLAILLAAALATATVASESAPTDAAGRVELPLDVYTRLVQAASDPSRPPRPVPAGYALGTAAVSVRVDDDARHASASVQVRLGIRVLEDEWVLIPVLPVGTPVESVHVDGKVVQLIATPDGLGWSTNRAGSYTMELIYRVDATRSTDGYTLPLPLPRAAAIHLEALLPGAGLDASVIPAAGTRVVPAGTHTRVEATIPTTSAAQLSWRVPVKRGHTISRASYSGTLAGDAVVWTGELTVELFGATALLPLLPRSATLSDVRVDGEPATILVEGERFATPVRGEGSHSVTVIFETPVERAAGPPAVELDVPRIPVSRYELTLPGRKELVVTPASNVTRRVDDERTVAVVHVPLTERVTFAWSEAVPDEIRTELRSNAAAYHTVHAEEGVLYVRARVAYEVTRGETNVIELALPPAVQINRIESASGAVTDWRVSEPDEVGVRVVSVFFDRKLSGPLQFDVHYDRSLRTGGADAPIEVPLLGAVGAQRQRGMVALLSSAELTLVPLDPGEATEVGENQLPPFVREAVELTIAHTFKYTDAPPRLLVEAAQPERARGKFDATVDTLISLGDVTLGGSAAVQVNVKSGRIMDLRLELPAGVSLLNLTAPSLRTYRVEEQDGARFVDVEFTRELEGQFRLDLTYERILADADEQVEVPTISVAGADFVQGRIAVEALSAVEVRPAVAEQLSSLDVNELPQQLVLRTTNPILLAYKYVHADTPHRLALRVTRHAVLGVQEAAIDHATYKTLFTPDGLMVTTSEFTVRNSRKQFLRVRLPRGSEVWSVFVDGRPEKPALAQDAAIDDEPEVLVKIINSTRPFTVQLVYATAGDRIRTLGTLRGALPEPDILVTRSRWDVFLPEALAYGDPATNMDVIDAREHVSGETIQSELARLEDAADARQAVRPLRISVPTAGVHYAFEKLYANQQGREAWFELPYASGTGALIGQSIGIAGTLFFWAGIAAYALSRKRARRSLAAFAAFAGLTVTVVAVTVYHVSATPSLVVSLALLLSAAAYYTRRSLPGWRGVDSAERP